MADDEWVEDQVIKGAGSLQGRVMIVHGGVLHCPETGEVYVREPVKKGGLWTAPNAYVVKYKSRWRTGTCGCEKCRPYWEEAEAERKIAAAEQAARAWDKPKIPLRSPPASGVQPVAAQNKWLTARHLNGYGPRQIAAAAQHQTPRAAQVEAWKQKYGPKPPAPPAPPPVPPRGPRGRLRNLEFE